MTEDDAKKKWCPFARVRDQHQFESGGLTYRQSVPVSINRGDDALAQEVCCIGSACMAWRDVLGVKSYPDGSIDVQLKPTSHGYCGLAGKP